MRGYNVGPFQNLVKVHWATPGASRPRYVLLTLSVTKKGGSILTHDWLDSDYAEPPLVSCYDDNDAVLDALPLGFASKIDGVSYRVRVLEETIYYAYGEGTGWRAQPVAGGPLSFNQASMPASAAVSGGYGNSRGFSYPYGSPNFSHSTGSDIDIPHPFDARARFKTGTDVKAFYYLTVLDGGPLCYQPFGYRPGDVGWQVYAVSGYGGRAAERDIASFPLNLTYAGQPLALIGTRTDTAIQAANGQPVSTFCELLFEVPPEA